MVQVLSMHENKGWNKRVESTGRPCLDEGSIPSSSTSFRPREDFTLVRVDFCRAKASCALPLADAQAAKPDFRFTQAAGRSNPLQLHKRLPSRGLSPCEGFFILSRKVPNRCLFAISKLNVKWHILERKTPKIRTWLRWFSNITKVVGKRHT